MKLGTLKNKSKRDGDLIIVSNDNMRGVLATEIAPSLREAVEDWANVQPRLAKLYEALNTGKAKSEFQLDLSKLHSPFPRAFQWADGSAFIQHVKLVRKARNAPLPETLLTTPLMYQGGSDSFLAPTEDIPQVDFAHGTDFEGEVVVVTDDVPMGVDPDSALKHIVLVMLCNDVSLRGLIPEELANGFGFFQSKPSSAFSIKC
jgi:fumarylacetoacetate (FAA) hydrolase